MSKICKRPQDGTPVILAIYEDGKLWYRPEERDMILAAVCNTATHEADFLEYLMRAAAALLGAAKDGNDMEMRFLHYVGLVREQLPAFRREAVIRDFKIRGGALNENHQRTNHG